MKTSKTLFAILISVISMFSFRYASGQAVGEKGQVCVSYDQCTGVDVGYFIYPNPANDILNIDLTSKEQATIFLDLCDAEGRQIVGFERKVIVEGRTSTQFNLTNLPAGYYFVRIKDITRETLETIKFLKA
jgi:hypothetical protein